jgi:hypothetical protein
MFNNSFQPDTPEIYQWTAMYFTQSLSIEFTFEKVNSAEDGESTVSQNERVEMIETLREIY